MKCGGNAMTEERLQRSFAHDGATQAGRPEPGSGAAADRRSTTLRRIGKQGTFVQGMRVTDAETMEVVEWVLGGPVQEDIVMMINGSAARPRRADQQGWHAHPGRKKLMVSKGDPSQPLDIGFVGDITRVEPAVVKALQDGQFIPVISPIGYGGTAPRTTSTPTWSRSEIAECWAPKLLMMTNAPGVPGQGG